jgi:hypothetical protein
MERRRELAGYVRSTLFRSLPSGVDPLPLCLPVLRPAILSDLDIYTAGVGAEDRRVSRWRDKVGDAAKLDYADPTGERATRADGRRRFLATQLPGRPLLLKLERVTVLALLDGLSARDRQIVQDLATLTMDEQRRAYGVTSLDAVKFMRREALDHLLDGLYAFVERRAS